MIDLHNALTNIKQHGNDQYSAYCPSCESGKSGRGEGHLYFKDDGKRWLLDCKKGCSIDEICYALNVELKDLFAEKESFSAPSSLGGGEKLREHVYCSADGLPVGKKEMRRKPDGEKTAIWYRWEKGGYKKGLNGQKMPLYRLPQIMASHLIYIVEGEKDVETLERLGYTATTTANGAGQAKLSSSEKDLFAGRAVVIIGDNDEPGRNYAEILYNTLRKKAGKVTKIDPLLIWDELPEKGDVSDIHAKFGDEETRERLKAAIHEARESDLRQRPYIYTDESGKSKVQASFLADFARKNLTYIFVKSNAKSAVQRYVYSDGVYRHVSDAELKGYIKGVRPSRIAKHAYHKRSIRTT